jgi:hypothetical protein
MSQIKEFCEIQNGLHGGRYYYVLDNGLCIHISRYAVKSISKNKEEVCYYVDESKIAGKPVLTVESSKSGPLMGPSEVQLINRCVDLPHLAPPEKKFMEEWNRYYIPMLEFIKTTAVKGIVASNVLEFHLKHLSKYPLSLFISYSSDARLKSFEVLTREIHEIWIALKILKELGKEIDLVWFKQSGGTPIASIDNYSLWYEFDFTPHTMCEGFIQYYCGSFDVTNCKQPLPQWLSQIYSRIEKVLKRPYLRAQELLGIELKGLRPDIMFTQAVRSCRDLFESSTLTIKLIIECKNLDYEYWATDIEKQIIPYKRILQPEHMVVASLKPVPQGVKEWLKHLNIRVIDNVYPGGIGEKQLIDHVKHILLP